MSLKQKRVSYIERYKLNMINYAKQYRYIKAVGHFGEPPTEKMLREQRTRGTIKTAKLRQEDILFALRTMAKIRSKSKILRNKRSTHKNIFFYENEN